MKKFFLLVTLFCVMFGTSLPNAAFAVTDFEREFQVFKEKLAKANSADTAVGEKTEPVKDTEVITNKTEKPVKEPDVVIDDGAALAPKLDAAPKEAVPEESADKSIKDRVESTIVDKIKEAKDILEVAAKKPETPAEDVKSGTKSEAKKEGADSQDSGNPLGLAAHLPVSSKPPLTAAAMGADASAEGLDAQDQVEADLKAQKEKIDRESFNMAIDSIMPLKPEQIRELLNIFKERRQASETPITMPKPKTEVETISLDPSTPPAIIKTAPGYVTTITIVDATGAPWAIQDMSWAGAFTVTGPEKGGHIIRIIPTSSHGVGNLSVRLVDLISPITFSLSTGLDEVYYRFDARIPKTGPLAKTGIIEYGGLTAVVGKDENLVQFLEGTPPEKSEELKVNGVDGRTKAWKVDKQIYLRTPLNLLSPSWDASVTSSDGMNVYALSDTPVVILSDEGRMVEASIIANVGGSL